MVLKYKWFELKAFTLICGLICSIYSQYSEAQPVTINNYFGPVLYENFGIAGNFGEIRSGHFHAGIDFKTNEKEGLPVYSPANGYISRVRVSSGGYGKALYINHPNGTTTVFGHLKRFKEDVEDKIRSLQYKKEEFEQQIFPGKEEFPVNKGDLIGWSGNSGGSYGPHLHFEIRNTASEKPFDPILAGIQYSDTIAPVINEIALYSPGPFGSLFNAQREIISLDTSKNSITNDTINCSSEFFIGINCYDLASDGINKIGINKIQISKNDTLLFEFAVRDFEFSDSRYVNACIDFPYKSDSAKTFIICHKLKDNLLDFYPYGDGIFNMKDKETANFNIIVYDNFGNYSNVDLILSNSQSSFIHQYENNENRIDPDKTYNFETLHYQVSIPKKCFYETVSIDITLDSSEFSSMTKVLKLSPDHMAIHNSIELSFNIENIPDSLKSKILICKIPSHGNIISCGGEIEHNKIKTLTRSSGNYSVFADTLPPAIEKPIKVFDEFIKEHKIVIKVHDNLSGVKNYTCTINKKWVLSEYNSLRGELTIYKNSLPPESYDFPLEIDITDHSGNTTKSYFNINN